MRVNLKLFLLIWLIGLVSVGCAKGLSDNDFVVYTHDNFHVELTSSLLFQIDSTNYAYVALEPLNSTIINGSSCTLWMAPDYGGKFQFTAQDNAVVQINTEMYEIGKVRFNGVSAGDGSQYNIVSSQVYVLEWSYVIAPLISMALILALIGICMSFGGPFYVISKWRDDHDIRGMINGTVIMLIGFAFLIGWLFV